MSINRYVFSDYNRQGTAQLVVLVTRADTVRVSRICNPFDSSAPGHHVVAAPADSEMHSNKEDWSTNWYHSCVQDDVVERGGVR
jgi:hypothetical protein